MRRGFFDMYVDWFEGKYLDGERRIKRGVDTDPVTGKHYKYFLHIDQDHTCIGTLHSMDEFYGILMEKKRVSEAAANRLASLEEELGDDLVNAVVKNMRYLMNAPEETAQSILSAFAEIEDPEEAWDYVMGATEEYRKGTNK